MTRHVHDDGQLVAGSVDYDYVEHHRGDEPGLLVVRGVPAELCAACDEFWFSDSVGFRLARLIEEHRPAPCQVATIDWIDANAA
jgi:hypothetical protein